MLTTSFVRRALLVCLVTLGSAGAAQAQETLKYKWNKGDVIYYRSTQDQSQKMTTFGMATSRHQEWVERFEVKEVADGVATLDMSIVSVKLAMEQQPGGKGSFDSTKPSDQQFEGEQQLKSQVDMGPLVGEHITVVIDSTGAVKKVEGMSKAVEKVIAKQANPSPMAGQALRITMSDEAMRGNLERYFKVLPEKPVKAGDTWNSAVDQSLGGIGGRLRIDSTWTMNGVEAGAAASRLSAQLKIDAAPPKEGEDQGIASKMKTKITDGKGTAEVLFDAHAGQLVKSQMEMTLPIESTMAGQNGQAMTLKVDSTQKSVFERIPAPEKKEEAPKPSGT